MLSAVSSHMIGMFTSIDGEGDRSGLNDSAAVCSSVIQSGGFGENPFDSSEPESCSLKEAITIKISVENVEAAFSGFRDKMLHQFHPLLFYVSSS